MAHKAWKGAEGLDPKSVAEIQGRGWEIVGSLIYVEPDLRGILARQGKKYSLWVVETDNRARRQGQGTAETPLGKYHWCLKAIEGA